jgi:ribosomal protein S12 methylthiotransferase
MNLGGFNHHAYLKIAEGCNRRCAYCAIPLIRGKQVSRSIEDIVEEAKELEKQGVKEITLIAQDTTYFGREKGKKGGTLAQLLKAILDNTNIPWIRTLYWYPMFVDDELLDLMANEPRLVKYVDMPIQHASDNMLKNMKRNYRKKELVDILHKIRERIPGVTLRTTVLVGFPGETHEDFEELMELLQDVQFDHLGGFVFSPEEGTPVMEMDLPAVDESEARARLDAVTDLQEELDAEHAEAMIGKKVRIIIDQVAEESEYHFYGRTEGNSMENDDIVKVLEGDADVGEFYDALVVDAEPHELIVKIVE